jgi:hypothetical protein
MQLADRLDLRAAYQNERPIEQTDHDREWELLAAVDEAIDAFARAVQE